MLEILVEKPVTILLAGGLVFAVLLMMGLQTGRRKVLIAAAAILGITFLLLIIERLVESPSEQLRRTLREISAAVNRQDLPDLLTYVHSSATAVREQATMHYNMYQLQEAAITKIWRVHVKSKDTAQVDFTVRVTGGPRAEDIANETGYRYVEVQFAKENQKWKVTGYEHYSPEQAMVGQATGNRVAPDGGY